MAERKLGCATLLALTIIPPASAAPPAAHTEDPCVVRRVHEEVTGLRKRPWLGGELEAVENDGRQMRVAHLLAKGPLAAAGVKVNDVILSVAGAELPTMPLTSTGASAGDGLPGSQHGVPVVLRLRRDGAEQELQVVPSRLPDTALPYALGLKVLRDQGWFRDGEVTSELLSVAADDCLAQDARDRLLKLRQQAWLGIDHLRSLEQEEGTELHVLKLNPEGPLAAAGVLEGDLILAIDRIDFSTMLYRRARVAIRQVLDGVQPGRPLHLRLRRGDSELEVETTPPVLRGYPLAKRMGARLLSAAKIYFYED